MRVRWTGALLAVATLSGSVAALAQTRFRRPVDPAPAINYGYDNNGGAGGCRDYTCGGRCYDGHTGTDIPVALGTIVRAGAAGTVVATNNGCANYGAVGNTCGGRCGNYVQLEHADGTRSIYCHMQLDSLRVSRGQTVSCGQELGRSASSGSSSGPHLHFGWSTGGSSRDPFTGGCSNGGNRWVDQRPYPNIPGEGCEGPPPPPPPPPCLFREGPFGFHCAGPIAGMTCTSVNEPADPHAWSDNYFCSDLDRGLRWSYSGPIAGMSCTPVNEGSEPTAHTWGDNYLCAPGWLPYRFQFSSAGPVAGMSCVQWSEPSDPHTWNDNFLCWSRSAECRRRNGPFAWSCDGPVQGLTCTAVGESSDPHTWSDNFVCTEGELGLRWSSAGPIAGMDCTAITEGSEPAEHTWNDNFLCLPRGSAYSLRWSSAGPIAGLTCLAWYEPGDPHTWEDNFLCWQYTPPPPPPDAGAVEPDVVTLRDATAPRDAPVPRDVVAALDAPGPDPDTPPAPREAGVDDAGDPWPDTAVVEPGGCGCRASGTGAGDPLALLGVCAIALHRRRLRRASTRR
ncbi:MAG: M23 family metallopeptidase [Polyangiales bacterium]